MDLGDPNCGRRELVVLLRTGGGVFARRLVVMTVTRWSLGETAGSGNALAQTCRIRYEDNHSDKGECATPTKSHSSPKTIR
jgi:hypothetical protein